MTRYAGSKGRRRSAGHTLYALTGDLTLVQDQLGHRQIKTTAQIYAQGKVDSRLRAGIEAFGRLVNGTGATMSESVSAGSAQE